ncbi:MAG: twin-arginine translocase TatA/TatE family subunit [Bacteroidales bacterium]|nr:twin-arginine translocase TatA/TatE family subunit [Bacteroidales bacterium]
MKIPFLFIGTTEVIALVVVILLLFGGKKIPELMHGVGKGVKSFKDGMNGKDEEEKKGTKQESATGEQQ